MYMCFVQFVNLRNFEIAPHRLEIFKLQAFFEMGIQFRNCVAQFRNMNKFLSVVALVSI